MNPIQIAIVDDHTLFRNGLAKLLEEFKEIKINFEASNGQELMLLMEKHPFPEMILMDIKMPRMDGYATTTWLKKTYPQIRILALTMHDDEASVIKMIQCGASGYVLKESKPMEVLEAILTIKQKGVYINELITGKLIRTMALEEAKPKFTKKEIEFLKLCCSELTYKQIAEKMFCSPRTIDNYRESLFQKLNLKSRTGLVLYAIQQGLMENN